MKLQLLCKAQGMLNALSGLVDDWIDYPPRERDMKAYQNSQEGDPTYNPVIKEKKFVNYAGTLYKAHGGVHGGSPIRARPVEESQNRRVKDHH